MPGDPKKVRATFYRTAEGSEPVRDWLVGLDAADRKAIGVDIALVEYGWPVGMPTCRSLGRGLWEVRSIISGSHAARVPFCIADDRLVLLHGLVKKSEKTSDRDMALARSRLKDVQ
jgi:phage-related protein